MGSGLVPWVGSAVVWDPGGPEAFQEEGSLSRWGLEGLTRDDRKSGCHPGLDLPTVESLIQATCRSLRAGNREASCAP